MSPHALIGQMSVGQLSVDQVSVGQMGVAQVSGYRGRSVGGFIPRQVTRLTSRPTRRTRLVSMVRWILVGVFEIRTAPYARMSSVKGSLELAFPNERKANVLTGVNGIHCTSYNGIHCTSYNSQAGSLNCSESFESFN